MTILLYMILIGGILIFLSQSSYARVIAQVDLSTSERRVHCIHHAVHSACGILVTLLVIALLNGDCQPIINITCAVAAVILVGDAATFLILDRIKQFTLRRNAIVTKWKSEKVFGPEHDDEVSVYRNLKEITEKNLLRDGLHLMLFAALLITSLCLM